MKYLKDVLSKTKRSLVESCSDQTLEALTLNEEETDIDDISVALAHLSDIMGMADDLYNTFSSLDEIDSDMIKTLEKAYIILDDLYAKADSKYDIVSYDLEDDEIGDEIKEELTALDESTEEEFSASTLSSLRMIGFRKVDPSHKVYAELNKRKNGRLLSLYGIPMRAGHYADMFVGVMTRLDKRTKLYFFYYEDEEKIYDTFSSETAFIKDLKALVGSGDISESFRPGHNMVPAPFGKNTYRSKDLRKLWGIEKDSGDWDNLFVAMFDNGDFGIINSQGVKRYSSVTSFRKDFEKFIKTQ